MYIVAIGWLFVAALAAIADTTVVGGVLTFVFWGVAPLALFLWLAGTPARRRAAERRAPEEAGTNDRTEGADEQ